MASIKKFFRAICAAFGRKKKDNDKPTKVGPEGQTEGVVELQPVIVHYSQGDVGGIVVGVDHGGGGGQTGVAGGHQTSQNNANNQAGITQNTINQGVGINQTGTAQAGIIVNPVGFGQTAIQHAGIHPVAAQQAVIEQVGINQPDNQIVVTQAGINQPNISQAGNNQIGVNQADIIQPSINLAGISQARTLLAAIKQKGKKTGNGNGNGNNTGNGHNGMAHNDMGHNGIRVSNHEHRVTIMPKPEPLSIEELQATANAQVDSTFFGRFPLEIRRKIYYEAWCLYLKAREDGDDKNKNKNNETANNATQASEDNKAKGPTKASPTDKYKPGTDLRLHIFSPNSSHTRLTHTRCVAGHGEGEDTGDAIDAPAQQQPAAAAANPQAQAQAQLQAQAAPTTTTGIVEDVQGSDGAWPFEMNGPGAPPRWFFEAWVLRLNWGGHWACQRAVQRRWVPGRNEGGKKEGGGRGRIGGGEAPFLRLFLTCKKMYLESAQSFFEHVTLIFTTSLDAHAFFLQRPHLFLPHLRHLELSITHTNDHLYLTKIVHDPGAPAGRRGTGLVSSGAPLNLATAAQVASTRARTLMRMARAHGRVSFHESAMHAAAEAEADTPRDGGHECMNLFCRVDMFGEELWRELVRGMRGAATGLRDVEITIAGRIPRNKVLDVFGAVAEEERQGWGGIGPGGYWVLPGMVVVRFTHWKRDYVQEGRKMVRIVEEEVGVDKTGGEEDGGEEDDEEEADEEEAEEEE